MSKVDVFENRWLDIVFEGRNKQYGAYQLRKQDSRTTTLALFSGIALMGLAMGIPAGINYLSPQETATTNTTPPVVIDLADDEIFKVAPPKPVEPPKPEVAPPAAAAPPAVDVTRFKPIIASTEPDPEIPTIEKLKTSNPGNETTPGTPGGSITNTTGPGVPGGTGESPEVTESGTGIETTASVDVMPEYPGGIKNFLTAVGRSYRVPESDEAQMVKVYVQFVVEKDGSLTDIKVIRDPKPELGLGKEAIRVLQKMKTKWEPGKKNGKPVRTAYNLPITVNIH